MEDNQPATPRFGSQHPANRSATTLYTSGLNTDPRWVAGNLDVDVGVTCSADVPVHHAVTLGIDRRLAHRLRKLTHQRLKEIAGAIRGVAIRQHIGALLFQDSLPYPIGNSHNGSMASNFMDRRRQRDHGSDAIGHLRRDGAGHCPTQAMTDNMNLSFGGYHRPSRWPPSSVAGSAGSGTRR